MKYNSYVICDRCGREIEMPHGRIEWRLGSPFMHVVHHECSEGFNNPRAIISDIIMDQGFYNSDLVYERLNELKGDYPNESTDIQNVIDKLFG